MPAYLLETGRSYPNPIDGQGYKTTFKRPASGKYRSHSSQPLLGTGIDYQITFEGSGPGSMPMGVDSIHYIGDQDPVCVLRIVVTLVRQSIVGIVGQRGTTNIHPNQNLVRGTWDVKMKIGKKRRLDTIKNLAAVKASFM